MSALAEKMKAAGVDTIGAQLTQICLDALRDGPRDPVKAWRKAGELFGYEFVMRLAADMDNTLVRTSAAPQVKQSGTTPPLRERPQAYKPRVIPQDRLEKRRKLREAVRSKLKNSAGVAWSDVSWHELPLLTRDGREAAALLAAGPAHVPNDGRTVGAVLGVNQVDLIVGAVRA